MLTISLQSDNLLFRDISKENLERVLELYNQNEQNMYATGIDHIMSLEEIHEKYLEVLVNSHEFFTGLFIKTADQEELIGVIKGRIDYENCEEAWISSILIDSKHQYKGIGKKTINTVIELLNKTYDVRRIYVGLIEGNKIGKSFWQRLGFNYHRTIDQYMKLNNNVEDFIIMKKDLYS
ncbi:MAG: GNAT family N-acetyltransferase [Bacillota bacterium]